MSEMRTKHRKGIETTEDIEVILTMPEQMLTLE